MIEFFGLNDVEDDQLKFVVILTKYKNKWIYIKHKHKDTWENPSGNRENNEDISLTASRELIEKTDAKEFFIEPICNYAIEKNGEMIMGRLFNAEVYKLGNNIQDKIKEVKAFKEQPTELEYPEIQKKLISKLEEHLKIVQ